MFYSQVFHSFCSFVFLQMVCWIKSCNMDSVLEGTMNVEFMSPDTTRTSTLVPHNPSCDGEPTRMHAALAIIMLPYWVV